MARKRRCQLDFNRYERYLSLRRLYEFLALAAVTPTPIRKPRFEDRLSCMLEDLTMLRAEEQQGAA